MNDRFLYKHILPLVVMLADLAVAYDLDRWREVLRQENALTPNLTEMVLWSYTLSNLLLAAVLLATFAWVVFRPQRSPWVARIYILVGLLFSSFPILYFSPAAWLIAPLALGSILSFSSYLITAGAFIAITGLAILVFPRRDIPT